MGSAGRNAYRGFEYQRVGAVWLLLEFASTSDDCSIEIEPLTGEDAEVLASSDLEADTGERNVGLAGSAASEHYIVQFKARSVGAWTESSVNEILIGPRKGGAVTRGMRRWPFPELEHDPSARFLFVTDAVLGDGLRPLAVASARFVNRPTGDRLDKTVLSDATASVAERVGVLQQQPIALLEKRALDLLLSTFKVPASQQQRCFEVLLDRVRRAMLGDAHRVIDRSDLMALARSYGGDPEGPLGFVEPLGFSDVRKQLDSRFAVVLVGDPGVGKTTAAERLLFELRTAQWPFEVFQPRRPGELRNVPEAMARVVIYIDDPFGRYEPSDDASDWARELEAFLQRVRTDMRLVVTSRLAFAAPVLEGMRAPRLKSCVVDFDRVRFDKNQRHALLREQLALEPTLDVRNAAFVRNHADAIVKELHRPLSYSALCGQLVGRGGEQLDRQGLRVILELVATEELGEDLKQTFSNAPERRLMGLCAIWLSIEVWGREDGRNGLRTRVDSIDAILNEEHCEADVTGAWNQLCNYRWLRQQRGGWDMHPSYVDACAAVLKAEAGVAGRVAAAVLKNALDANDIDEVAKVCNGVDGRLPLPSALRTRSREAGRAMLVASARHARPAAAFRTSFDYLKRFGDDSNPIDALVSALGSTRKGSGTASSLGWLEWTPPTWKGSLFEAVRDAPDTPRVIGAFIHAILPDAHWYVHFGENSMVDFLYSLCDASVYFDAAVAMHGDYSGFGAKVVAVGAARSTNADIDSLFGIARSIVAEAKSSLDAQDTSDEDAFGYFEHLGELYWAETEVARGLVDEIVIRDIRDNGGRWALGQSDDLLFKRFASLLEHRPAAGPEKVRAMAAAASPEAAAEILLYAGQHDPLFAVSLEALPHAAHHRWAEVLSRAISGPFGDADVAASRTAEVAHSIRGHLAALEAYERVALLFDLDGHPYTKSICADLLPAVAVPEQRGFDALRGDSEAQEEETWNLLFSIAKSEWSARRVAMRLLVREGRLPDEVLFEAVRSPDSDRAIAAVEAAEAQAPSARLRVLDMAFVHTSAAVRKRAIEVWSKYADDASLDAALRLAEDPTPSVRICLAEALAGTKSAAATARLTFMLADSTDTSEAARHGHDGPPECGVSAAAGRALLEIDPWPPELLETLEQTIANDPKRVADASTRARLGRACAQRRLLLSTKASP